MSTPRTKAAPDSAPSATTHVRRTAEHGVVRATLMREVMTPAPHTIGSDQTLARAHRMMRDGNLRHLPVLRAGELVGVLSERDLYFMETIRSVDANIDQVLDAMTPDVFTVGPDDLLKDVASEMAVRKYGCAVVVEGSRVLGIFTATDALHHLAEKLG